MASASGQRRRRGSLLALIGPVTVKVGHWYSPDPDVATIDLLEAEAPGEFVTELRRAEKPIEDLGFRLAGHFRVSNAVPGGTIFVTLFENVKEKQTAHVVTVIAVSATCARR